MDLILATSKAGHDKGQTYVIIEEKGDSFVLANGETKPLSKTKTKKKIHLQIIKNIPAEVHEISDSLTELNDLSIKRILKEFNRRNKNV